MRDGDTAVSQLLNLGPKSTAWLHDIGIYTLADLEAMGVVDAYCLIQAKHEGPSLNLLYALYGAVHGIPWNLLTTEQKAGLKAEVDAFGGFGTG